MALRLLILDGNVNYLDHPVVLKEMRLPKMEADLIPKSQEFEILRELGDEFSPTSLHRDDALKLLSELRSAKKSISVSHKGLKDEIEKLCSTIEKYLASEGAVIFQFTPIEFV